MIYQQQKIKYTLHILEYLLISTKKMAKNLNIEPTTATNNSSPVVVVRKQKSLTLNSLALSATLLVSILVFGIFMLRGIGQVERQRQEGIVVEHYDFKKCPYQRYLHYLDKWWEWQPGYWKNLKKINLKHCKKLYQNKLKYKTQDEIFQMQSREFYRGVRFDIVGLEGLSVMVRFLIVWGLALVLSGMLTLYFAKKYMIQRELKSRTNEQELASNNETNSQTIQIKKEENESNKTK